MLVLHLGHLGLPLSAFLVFLLLKMLALLLNPHLLELEHLNLVIDVLFFHCAQLELVFDLINLCHVARLSSLKRGLNRCVRSPNLLV